MSDPTPRTGPPDAEYMRCVCGDFVKLEGAAWIRDEDERAWTAKHARCGTAKETRR